MNRLVEISNYYGKNSEYVLAGGGNTSFKDGKYLYVKGSGTTLATIDQSGFVKMDLHKVNEIMNRKYSTDSTVREAQVLHDLMNARADGESKRPSVETSLHALMPFNFVVHLHPALVNGLTCAKDGEKVTEKLWGGEYIWIDIVEPGYTLAVKVKERLDNYRAEKGKDANVLILQNHGIFVGGDTVEDIKNTYDSIMNTLRGQIKAEADFSDTEYDGGRAALISPVIRVSVGEAGNCVSFVANKELMKIAGSKEAFASLTGAYTPDHIVYNKAEFLFVSYDEDLEKQYALITAAISDYMKKYGYAPRIIAVEKTGFFVLGKDAKSVEISTKLLLDEVKVSVYAESFGGVSFMPQRLVDFIKNWEVESYRSKKSASSDGGRIPNKIVVVTGSAQGFGQGIAEDLFKEGANVVLADLNYDLAKTVADRMNENAKGNRAFAYKCDVTSEQSVEEMLQATVLRFGGLDVFVNNAGIVRAGSLEEMTLGNFELVTKVNYNAYFICVKYASKIMKLQHRFDATRFSDIIQINSKSGLTGSNKNFAYAGSKFGGLGLTQSFALELIPYNIKVNSICPGNFLDGPLWTDPEKGLFVQYFRAGKVEGAKSVADVRKYYESKVPAGRGCQTSDVVKAIYYAIEQVYETGQAIPVTGGQNMLK